MDDTPDEEWDEEEGEELPVVGPDGEPAPVARSRAGRPGRRSVVGKGNTSRSMAGFRRTQVIREAQGVTTPETDGSWRDDLSMKNRGTAAAKLSSRAPTHNAGSGFGLA